MMSLDLVSSRRWKWNYLATSLELTWEKIKMEAKSRKKNGRDGG